MQDYVNDPQGLHGRFWSAFQREPILAISSVIARAHLQAGPKGKHLYGVVGEERSGLFRWAQTDYESLLLQGKFPGVNFTWEKNPEHGGHHVDISAFNFRLLIVHDGDPGSSVPISDYGKTLAKPNQMLMFPDEGKDRDKNPAEKYLVVLFHCKNYDKGRIPQILELRFPDGEGGYAASAIDVYQEFSELKDVNWLTTSALKWIELEAVEQAKVEDIGDDAFPKTRIKEGRKD